MGDDFQLVRKRGGDAKLAETRLNALRFKDASPFYPFWTAWTEIILGDPSNRHYHPQLHYSIQYCATLRTSRVRRLFRVLHKLVFLDIYLQDILQHGRDPTPR
jgi:hypothetical protein